MGKLELNKKKKEDALYNTAFELFTTKGPNKTTISDIVEKAGVAKGTFYLYFKDKYDIRNKLASHKTSDLFYDAYQAVRQNQIEGFSAQLHFMIDHILDALEKDYQLLIFVSKNLSWAVFQAALEDEMPDTDVKFYDMYLQLLKEDHQVYEHPDLGAAFMESPAFIADTCQHRIDTHVFDGFFTKCCQFGKASLLENIFR